MPDALAVLADDHHHLLELLERLRAGAGARDLHAGAPGDSERSTVAEQLTIAASRHEAIEERCVWPLVRTRLEQGDELAERGVEQEEAGKKLLHELEHTPPGQDLAAVVMRLDRALREHIGFEESEVWPKLRLALSDDELGELGRRLEQAGRVAPTRPHLRTPSNPRLLGTVGPAVGALDRARDAVSGRGRDEAGRRRVVLARLAAGLPLAAVGGFVLWRLLARLRRPGITALRRVAGDAVLAELALRGAAEAARAEALGAARSASSAARRGRVTTEDLVTTIGSATHDLAGTIGSATHDLAGTIGSAAHDAATAAGSTVHGLGSALGQGVHGVGSKLRR